jgi:hypothetical protein
MPTNNYLKLTVRTTAPPSQWQPLAPDAIASRSTAETLATCPPGMLQCLSWFFFFDSTDSASTDVARSSAVTVEALARKALGKRFGGASLVVARRYVGNRWIAVGDSAHRGDPT